MRGDIHRFVPKDVRGHKQSGPRYAVVLQSDDLRALSTLLVAPTSTAARPTLFRPAVNLMGKTTFVLLEQTTVVTPDTELGDFVGRLDPAEMESADRALKLVLGLF